MRLLREDGFDVAHRDPFRATLAYESLAEVCRGADLVAVLVGHDKIVDELNSQRAAILGIMRRPMVVAYDVRN